MATSQHLVGIVMGSDSDWPVMEGAARVLKEFGIPCEVRVLSAHRSPAETSDYARSASRRGLKVLIAGAGGAAHLPGVLAAQTRLPVVGVPVAGSHLGGLDSLLSIVQMPRGVPVATVGIGRADNAALLAVQMLALADQSLAERLDRYKADLAQRSLAADEALQEKLEG